MSIRSPVRMLWKAVSTLVESNAEVSMKDKPSFSANALASSVGTDLKWRRSDLLPGGRGGGGGGGGGGWISEIK